MKRIRERRRNPKYSRTPLAKSLTTPPRRKSGSGKNINIGGTRSSKTYSHKTSPGPRAFGGISNFSSPRNPSSPLNGGENSTILEQSRNVQQHQSQKHHQQQQQRSFVPSHLNQYESINDNKSSVRLNSKRAISMNGNTANNNLQRTGAQVDTTSNYAGNKQEIQEGNLGRRMSDIVFGALKKNRV